MAQFPDAFGVNITAKDISAVSGFYECLYPDASVSEGEFAGINYRALMGDGGEVAVCIFQGGEGNPLAESFPTIKVESVADYEAKVVELGGKTLIPSNPCPCTGAPFAICEDSIGNQFMIKQPRV